MMEAPKVTHIISEESLTKKKIEAAMDAIADLKVDRQRINERIKVQEDIVQSLGISKAAFKMVLKVREMTADQRIALDFGYSICRQAIGCPVQRDFFEKQNR